MAMQLVVLGSGQDGGNPQVGAPFGFGSERTASSIALRLGDRSLVLFDASPDIRIQYQRLTGLGWSASSRNPFDAVFVTHGHIGHYLGLAHFGREVAATARMPLHAPASLLEYLGRNQPWKALFDDAHLVGIPSDDRPANLADVSVTAIPVQHRAEHSATVAYSIADQGGPRVLYLPDIDAWQTWDAAEETIAAHDVAFLDATFAEPNEVPGRDLTAVPHPFIHDTIRRFAGLTPGRRIVLTHLNHTNELADPRSDLHAFAAESGFEVAFDGMRMDLS